MREFDVTKDGWVMDTLLTKEYTIVHDRSCGAEFAKIKNKDTNIGRKNKSNIGGQIGIPEGTCPKVFLIKLYKFLKSMNCDICNLDILCHDESVTIGCINCSDCDFYQEDNACSKLSDNKDTKSYVFGQTPPENTGLLWVDTNERGGLKFFDSDEKVWKHVPAFAVNVEDL